VASHQSQQILTVHSATPDFMHSVSCATVAKRLSFALRDSRGVKTQPLLHVRSAREILGTLLGVLRPQGVFISILVSLSVYFSFGFSGNVSPGRDI
jgi:hypothetical protein